MFGITVPAITSAARTIAGYAAVYLVAKGFVVSDEADLLVTAFVSIVGVAASMYFRRTNAIVAQAAALPEVGKIVASPEVSSAVESGKVVAR